MTEKKRTTVTTIETHEVWIVRRPEPDLSEITDDTAADLAPVSPLTKTSNGSETGESHNHEE